MPGLQQFPCGGIQTAAAELRGIMHVHLQIQLSHAQLAHHTHSRHEHAALLQLAEHICRQGFIRLPMAGIGGDTLRNPHPVLIQLAGQLHKIACHPGAGMSHQLHITQQAVQYMPEFMEKGKHIHVSKQRRSAIDGRLKVAHQHSQVGRALVSLQRMVAHPHDPGAGLLGRARVQVHIERPHVPPGCLIMNSIQLHLRVPHLVGSFGQLLTRFQADSGQLRNTNGIQALKHREHTRHHILLLVVRAQGIHIELAHLLAHQISVVVQVPGIQLRGPLPGEIGDKTEHGIDFGIERGHHLTHHIIHKVKGGLAAAHHTPRRGQICICTKAQQRGQLSTELHHPCYHRFIVELRGITLAVAPFPAEAAGFLHIAITEHIAHAGIILRNEPLRCLRSTETSFLSLSRCPGHPVLAHASQTTLVLNDKLPGLHGILAILIELQVESSQFLLNSHFACLLFRRQVCAAILEGIDHLLHITLAGSRKSTHPRSRGCTANHAPELIICRDRSPELSHKRSHLGLGLAHLRRVHDHEQIRQKLICRKNLTAQLLIRPESVLPGSILRGNLANGFHFLPRTLNSQAHICHTLLRSQARPTGIQTAPFQERMFICRKHRQRSSACLLLGKKRGGTHRADHHRKKERPECHTSIYTQNPGRFFQLQHNMKK